jgi:hypothetical protein
MAELIRFQVRQTDGNSPLVTYIAPQGKYFNSLERAKAFVRFRFKVDF